MVGVAIVISSHVRRTNCRTTTDSIIPIPGDVLNAKCIAWLLLAVYLCKGVFAPAALAAQNEESAPVARERRRR